MRQTYKRRLTAQEREAEIEATVAALPQTLDAETLSRFPFEKNAIIYRSENRDNVRIYCSYCGGTTVVPKVKFEDGCSHAHAPAPFGFADPVFHIAVMSGDTCKCPMCYAPAKAVHIGEFGKWYLIDEHLIITFHVVRGHIAMLEWRIEKRTDENGRVNIGVNRLEGAVFVDGTPVLVKGYFQFMYSQSRTDRWERLKKFRDYIGRIGSVMIDRATVDRTAFEQSDMPNCALYEYLNETHINARPVGYLRLYLKHQAAENLVRSDMAQYFTRVMDECSSYDGGMDTAKMAEYMDWREVKPRKMTGFDKLEKWIANDYPLWVSRYYRQLRESGVVLAKQELDVLARHTQWKVEQLLKWKHRGFRPQLLKVLRYLANQREKENARHARAEADGRDIQDRRDQADMTTLMDYWDAVIKVYGSLPEDLIWPKNMIEAHDEMLRRVKVKEDEAINAKMAELWAVRDRMSFCDEARGLMIFAARTQTDLIEEGKLLHHCVAGYATRHAEGKTTILLIRKLDEPTVPYYTLEWNGESVVQNRGLRNCGKTPEIQAFEDEWVQFMKEQERQNGTTRKRKAKSDGARAGA